MGVYANLRHLYEPLVSPFRRRVVNVAPPPLPARPHYRPATLPGSPQGCSSSGPLSGPARFPVHSNQPQLGVQRLAVPQRPQQQCGCALGRLSEGYSNIRRGILLEQRSAGIQCENCQEGEVFGSARSTFATFSSRVGPMGSQWEALRPS